MAAQGIAAAYADRPILVTGAAGFIGYHTARRYLEAGRAVVGIDNLNAYYDPALKTARLERLAAFDRFVFRRTDIADQKQMATVFEAHEPNLVIHLAAQAGVRHSLHSPHDYVSANLAGFINVLEGCRHHGVRHLVYASSSSVYGAVTASPFRERVPADHPVSLYGATKRANELMAHAYSHLFELPTTGLRFFTVYGPWGRPDMALFLFTRAILAGEPIAVFGEGQMQRSFTYVDDIVEGVVRIADRPAVADAAWNGREPAAATAAAPWRIYNIGTDRSVGLERLIELLEEVLGRKAVRDYQPMQPGDVRATAADVEDLAAAIGYRPDTPIEIGVRRFVDWYRDYYGT
ncbi:UDP-glucuronate 4-epimerase [Tepidamorphus gemmatus]|jgi:UDP-glucuronate 4-epimerase|uniref:UDP-glucuronate 4-epimerase n=1 Tax=Tepidamorphus gemmatus TaxID=747076 RepID=A0A4R3M7J1_9HYPH|nr:NAD-dependent epimerase/dehydratase family protein [Tepidamorphus gemmatus]TCT09310.1 UDP-glucuronate 4-epimerase [Tepidamorphus gemmatus]